MQKPPNYYTYSEEVALAPHRSAHPQQRRRSPVAGNQRQHGLQVGVRFESAASLTVVPAPGSSTPTDAGAASKQTCASPLPPPNTGRPWTTVTPSPFPAEISRLLLEQFPDVRRLVVQVNHRASNSFPEGPLDALPALATWHVGKQRRREGARTRTWRRGGPSGISVEVEFAVAAGTSDHRLRERLEGRLEALARELHGLRILLAPASAARSRVSRRKQLRPVLRTASSENDANRNVTTSNVVPLSLAWPAEGSALSSEGVKAFLRWLPCREGGAAPTAGIWSLSTPEEWSHLLLGTADPATAAAVTALPQRRLWMEAAASNGCREGGASSAPCRLTWSQGLEFDVASDNALFTKQQPLQRLLPFAAGRSDDLVVCPFADATLLTTVNESSPAARYDSLPLPPRTAVGDPLLRLERPESGEADAAYPRWQVDLRLNRRSGPTNRGTLVAILRNGDSRCATTVEFRHSLPLVLEPDWTSLTLSLVRRRVTTGTESDAVVQITWQELEKGHLDAINDSSFGPVLEWTFRYQLPPATDLEVALDYEPAFLPFETFPADPNRGFEIPPFSAAFATVLEGCQPITLEPSEAVLHSPSVLLMAPVPDLSMPFNVLSLTCTLYAFIIGSILNLALRRASERIKYALHSELKPPGLKERLKARLQAIRQRRSGMAQAAAKAREAGATSEASGTVDTSTPLDKDDAPES